MWYENSHFYYIWKPHGIPSTFGESEHSFLELLIDSQSQEIQSLEAIRWADSEYGLVNRLDTVTAWLLFFAKNQIIFNTYKKLQADGNIEKIYYADLFGKITHDHVVQDTIYHHYSDNSRMTLDPKVWRGKWNNAETYIQWLYYNEYTNTSTCKIIIKKWVRHQIRIHSSSIGHHIIWDTMYCPKSYKKEYRWRNGICLWSMGMICILHCEEVGNQHYSDVLIWCT